MFCDIKSHLNILSVLTTRLKKKRRPTLRVQLISYIAKRETRQGQCVLGSLSFLCLNDTVASQKGLQWNRHITIQHASLYLNFYPPKTACFTLWKLPYIASGILTSNIFRCKKCAISNPCPSYYSCTIGIAPAVDGQKNFWRSICDNDPWQTCGHLLLHPAACPKCILLKP